MKTPKELKDLGVMLTPPPKSWQGSFLNTIPVHYKELEKLLGVEFTSMGDKYSDEVYIKYKGFTFSIYCMNTSPRVGSVLTQKDEPRNSTTMAEASLELAELIKRKVRDADIPTVS